jgi:N-acetylglucosamine-6-sulfatase
MAAEAHNGGCSPRSSWLLTIAVLVVAALFSGAAYAAVLDSREAEQMTLGTGAAISGSHVILNATGERVTWVDGGAAGGTSVTATARHNGNGTSRVGLALYVNGVNRGSQFWARSVTANAERTWTGLNLSDGDDLQFRAVEVGSSEAVLFDRARVDGTPPAADSDGDGVPDSSDRCPGFPDSADADGDGTPDGCDTTPPPTTSPNILFVMTDDMPENLLNRMPEVDGRIVSEGINFPNAYVSQSLCCPSRASTFTGMYPHNTGIWSNGGAHGGVGAFRALGLEPRSVPIWLKGDGYTTGLVGKYLNGYDASYVPPGWSYWYGRGFGTGFANENGQIISYSGDVEGDTLTSKALGFLDRATDQAGDPPFALFVWTQAPHLRAENYAPRHANLYNDEVFDPPPSFNEADVSDKPQWVRNLPPISPAEQAELSELHRNQLRSLKGVDEMVGAMLDLLQERSELENTYVVFTTDNGAHMGEHRWWLGRGGYKNTAYEEAAGVPLAVRGPGIPANQVRPQLVLNNDFAPTFADIADAPVPEDVDGRSLLPLMNNTPPQSWRTAVLNEKPGGGGYHSLITTRYTYVEYKTGERELYDRQQDPYQLSSIHRTASPALLDSLHSRLALLKACAGQSCRTSEDTP